MYYAASRNITNMEVFNNEQYNKSLKQTKTRFTTKR